MTTTRLERRVDSSAAAFEVDIDIAELIAVGQLSQRSIPGAEWTCRVTRGFHEWPATIRAGR
jgi:hypothetical protein